MSPRWKLRVADRDRIEALSRSAGVHPLIAHLLLNRGIEEPNRVREFIEVKRKNLHDPEGLPGAVEAADRIVAAARANKKIVIYGDYDVDGVCGTSILWSCLRLAGATNVDYYIPHRVEEGYGVNGDAIRRLATEAKADLIVTVDCGISAVAEAKLARELGIDLIVTDHHTIGRDLPDACTIVHPKLPGSVYPFRELCGAGVAFKLAWQIAKAFGDGKKASPGLRDFLLESIGLAALATIADIVPLVDENRVFVRYGLGSIKANPSAGLRALMEVSDCLEQKTLSTGTVGFGLAPRINAAGRLERAMNAVELLTTKDLERARVLANELDACNKRRQDLEKTMVDEARALIDKAKLGDRGAIVLGKEGWHAGVIGIVASRLTETYHRPTIVIAIADGRGQGSGRSIPGFDLYQALHSCSEHLLAYGGHSAAAGLKLLAEKLEAFAEVFEGHCRATLAPEQLRKTLFIDAEVPLSTLSLKMVEAIESLEPYGCGNPRPVLMSENVRLIGAPQLMGEKNTHARLRFSQNGATLSAVGWRMGERFASMAPGSQCSVAFEPRINEWQGRRTVQLEIKDVQLADGAENHAATP